VAYYFFHFLISIKLYLNRSRACAGSLIGGTGEQGEVRPGRAWTVRWGVQTTGAAQRSGEALASSEHSECERRRESARSEREGARVGRGRELGQPTYRARGERRGHRGSGGRRLQGHQNANNGVSFH
jgi:hypothetical protein